MFGNPLPAAGESAGLILVIDDDVAVRSSLCLFLNDLGYRTLEADRGEKGLELFDQQPDLALIDLRMPGMNGLELMRRMREIDREIPIVVVSGTGRIGDVIDALRQGASDFLLKPIIDMTVLQWSVERALEQARLRRENREYRQHLEELVSRRTAALEALFDAAPLPILAVDEDCRVTLWNRAATELFGWTREEVIGQEYPLAPPGMEEQVRSNLQRAMAGQRFRGHEAVRRHRDGHLLTVKLSTAPLCDSNNQIYGQIVILEDVSEMRKLQSEAERSSRLASLGELSAGIAHEINNPNGLILLNLPTLKDFVSDALEQLQGTEREAVRLAGLTAERAAKAIPELLDDIEDGARRIKQIVEDLKAFAGQEEPLEQDARFDLNRSAEIAIRLTGNHLKKATFHLQTALADGPLLVAGSQQRIEQVIVNLLVNACEALTDRQQSIRVETGRSEAAGELFLKVIDQGRGISPAQLPHITDPFFTTRRQSGGTGLGLSVSARIVKEHQGRLEFRSQPGEGTCACLYLPAAEEELQ